MLQDNLRLLSYDAVVAFTMHKHFSLPEDIKSFRSWIYIFSDFHEKAVSNGDTEDIRLYRNYWQLFKIAKSKSTIKSVVCDGTGTIIFTLSFKSKSSFNFFTNKIDYLTRNH